MTTLPALRGVTFDSGRSSLNLGRPFVSVPFDYLLIGGGLSLLVTAALSLGARAPLDALLAAGLPVILLLCNSAHFASSTVRLYTKPGALREFPFLSMGLPLLTVGVLTASLAVGPRVGRHLQALYLTWSPYHYAAQAYGLALMYWYRSGTVPSPGTKRALRLSCLLPFLYAFLTGPSTGLAWLAPASLLGQPVIAGARYWASSGLWLAAWALLPLVFAYTWKRGAMPVISFLIVFSNGIWLLTLAYMDAFVWATIFHSLQYLAIVSIFHVKDRTQRPGARHGWAWHAAGFYAMCLPLGYLLFHAWPNAYLWAGYGFAESLLLTTAVINIHHFVVDAYIWRLRRANNQRIVAMAAVPASATPAA